MLFQYHIPNIFMLVLILRGKNDTTQICFVLPFAKTFLDILNDGVGSSVCACVQGFIFPRKTMCWLCKNFQISRPNLRFHFFPRCLTVLIISEVQWNANLMLGHSDLEERKRVIFITRCQCSMVFGGAKQVFPNPYPFISNTIFNKTMQNSAYLLRY